MGSEANFKHHFRSLQLIGFEQEARSSMGSRERSTVGTLTIT